MKLSESLKKVRNEKQIPQTKAATAAGVSITQYQNYEYSKSEPTAKVLIALADFYNVSLDYLVGRSNSPERL